MPLPNINHPIWKELITKRPEHQFDFFAFKLILSRLNMEYEKNPSPQAIETYARELKAFLEKNANLPKLQNDVRKLFGNGAMV
ncbi:MAG: hypothetical protein JW739_08660 [Opitutales bacterium]|nr:hypothetical protein [Opitutales bacterium]